MADEIERLVGLRDSGGLIYAEFAALKAKLIPGWTQALTRGAYSSVPDVVYPCDSRDHPKTAEPAYLQTGRPVSQEEPPSDKDPREGGTNA